MKSRFSPLTVMGLMSGTSVDAVDACLASLCLNEAGVFRHEILAMHTTPMPNALRSRLLRVMAEKRLEMEELCALSVAVGELFAETALDLLKGSKIPAEQVDCIGSHGQTLYHWPSVRTGKTGYSLQIGEPTIIAEKTGIDTIADFRPGDMAAGGQGAPLVCFADRLLFQHAHKGRCIQNIGGIANVTVVPAHGGMMEPGVEPPPMMAFDTGPGNMLIDAAMSHFYGLPYDNNGETAESGAIHEPLLEALLAHPYLRRTPPKTTGREDFGEAFFRECLLRFPELSPPDWLATLTQYTAHSIVDAYERFILPDYAIQEMVVGGGGTHNAFMLASIERLFQVRGRKITVKTHADFGIPNQYKEALAFAILAWAAYLRLPNNEPSCTGASHPVILGKFVLGSIPSNRGFLRGI